MKETCIYIFVIISMIFGSSFMTGCDDDFKYSKDYSVYDGVTLSINMADENNVLNLNLVNTTYRVRVDVTPNNVRINSQEYLYEIEDETIATVDENGLLTMKTEGETKLTVKLAVRPEISTSCTLNVKPVIVNKLNVPEEGVSVKENYTINLAEEITVTPQIANCVFDYKVADETIATIDKDGIITGKKAGSTTVTVSTTDGSNLSEVVQLTVIGFIYVTEIQLPVAEIGGEMLKSGNTYDIGALTKILPEDADNPSVKFSVTSGNDVVSVTEAGEITCIKAGEAEITAEAQDGSNVTSTINVTVYTGSEATTWNDRSGWKVTETSMWESGLNYVPESDKENGKPEKLIDGEIGTFLSIRKPEYYDYKPLPDDSKRPTEIYFVVDMQSEQPFNMIQYEHRHFNDGLAAKEIEISGSNDGKRFTVIRSGMETPFTVDGSSVYKYEFKVQDSKYRYVKVQTTEWTKYNGSAGGTAIQIAEFNVGTLE